MNDTEAEAYADKLLKEHGFVVQRIRRANSPTADLLVNDDAGSYLVEVTRKAPSAFLKQLREEARVTGVADGDRRLRASNCLNSIVRRKAHQLSNTAVLAQHRVLWLTAFHSDWEHLGRELERTLYGTARLVSVSCRGLHPPCASAIISSITEFAILTAWCSRLRAELGCT